MGLRGWEQLVYTIRQQKQLQWNKVITEGGGRGRNVEWWRREFLFVFRFFSVLSLMKLLRLQEERLTDFPLFCFSPLVSCHLFLIIQTNRNNDCIECKIDYLSLSTKPIPEKESMYSVASHTHDWIRFGRTKDKEDTGNIAPERCYHREKCPR